MSKPITETDVKVALRNMRCICKTVLSGEARASMRADLESASSLLSMLSTQLGHDMTNADLIFGPDER